MTRKRRQGDTATDPMLIDSIELQRPSKQSTQTMLEPILHKQSAAKRHQPAKDEPAAEEPTPSVHKRTNSTSKACTERLKCSDIRSFWCKKPTEEQPKAAATLDSK